jgi:hypothetical protein
MQVSAEIRYFWMGSVPSEIKDWYFVGSQQPFPVGGGGTRVDEYFRDTSQNELGAKRRGGGRGIEFKGLVEYPDFELAFPFQGQVEIWAKWATMAVEIGGTTTISVEKRRWLRKLDMGGPAPIEIHLDSEGGPIGNNRIPDEGCNIELVELRLNGGDVWWTFALEAFGTKAKTNLRLAAEALSVRHPPPFSPQVVASYPTWLNTSLP